MASESSDEELDLPRVSAREMLASCREIILVLGDKVGELDRIASETQRFVDQIEVQQERQRIFVDNQRW